MVAPDHGTFARLLTSAWPGVVHEIGSSDLKLLPTAGLELLDDLPAQYLITHAFDLAARADHLRVAKSGPIDRSLYVGDNDQLNISAIQRLFADGASVILNSLERFWSAASVACLSLGALLQTLVRVNSYISPHNSGALDVHYDSHDVLILQLKGSKDWTFYDGGFVWPTSRQSFSPGHSFIGKPRFQHTLHEGDLLYIPRGLAHRTLSTAEVSVHLTFGIHWLTQHDLLERVIALAVHHNVELRRALPVNWTQSSPENFERVLVVGDILGVDARPLIAEIQLATRRTLGMSGRSVPAFDTARHEDFGSERKFRITHSAPVFVEQLDNKVSVSRAGNTILYTGNVSRLSALLGDDSPPWNRAEFAVALGINEESALDVCRDLLGIGFIEMLDGAVGHS